MLDLINGKVDAVVIDDQPAKKFVEKNEGIVVLDEALTVEDYAIGIPKNSPELVELVNKVISDMKADGRYDALIAKYIDNN